MARVTVGSGGTVDNAVKELWSMRTIDERESALIFGKLFDRQYEAELTKQGGDTVHVSSVTHPNSGAARTLTIGGSGTLTYDAPSEANTNLVINTHAYSAFEVDTETDVLSHINWVEKYAPFAGYNVALKIDDDLAGLPDDFTNTVGTLTVDVTDQDILDAINYLDDASAPRNDRFFVFSPKQKNYLLQEERYVNRDYKDVIGSADPKALPGTQFSNVYGPAWFWSENVEGTNGAGHDNTLFQREVVALAIVAQYTKSMYEIDDDAEKHAVHAIYGIKEMRDNHGVWIKGI